MWPQLLWLGKNGKQILRILLIWRTWPKPDNRETAEAGRRNGRSDLEMGCYSCQQHGLPAGSLAWGRYSSLTEPGQPSCFHGSHLGCISVYCNVSILPCSLQCRQLCGACIILHYILVWQRGRCRYTVACTEILQLPPRFKWNVPCAFWWSLGKTSD